MSAVDPKLTEPLKPSFTAGGEKASDPPKIQKLIDSLHLLKHPEGGWFAETDRDALRIPNPFLSKRQEHGGAVEYTAKADGDDATRSAMTTIFYLLTPNSPKGRFHRNKGRTVHTLHKGRGRYVLIRTDEAKSGEKARVETFVVGQNIEKGERLQWIVDGDIYKASYLLPDDDDSGNSEEGLLISETVVPGFEFTDHNFMPAGVLSELVEAKQAEELQWLHSSN
ncbi:RmlC-like cupin domain-containing protein [Talaromyces proteolyticus]|uniref:RmlC-like cupin domain-containing protein n=1 Tax=Talaromyces proteolyticus TaxID=1131652 RepID=A0AAD4KJT9_9EURO|nr:RmlC-like cupin domain-containing protein [Talaromyces proteolyticus]KAH8689929.1 RmlC-like cupin domain-containing protein [Talaromyces proteolyticus]